MKKIITSILLMMAISSITMFAQAILTADAFFQQVQAKYAEINTYSANIAIKADKTVMQGVVKFKDPGLLRIDFSDPSNQVICFNKQNMTVYLPTRNTVLTQEVPENSTTQPNLATKQGLALMKTSFNIAWALNPDPITLPGTTESVHKLSLTRRSINEGFKQIYLYLSENTLLIRRIEGQTVNGIVVTMDFTNININQEISNEVFVFDPPGNASIINDFLFKGQN